MEENGNLISDSKRMLDPTKISDELNTDYGEKFTKDPVDRAGNYSKIIKCCGNIPKVLCCICAPCDCGPIKRIPEGHVGLKMEFGRLVEKLQPGLHAFNQCAHEIYVVDMRIQMLDIPVVNLLTKDNVPVRIDSFISYNIEKPELAQFKVTDFRSMTIAIIQGILKSLVVQKTLNELLTGRKAIKEYVTEVVDKKTDFFGVNVNFVEFKGIALDPQMERIMAYEAIAKVSAAAKVEKAKGDLDSAKMYRKSADLIKGNPISLQLQYFETLKQVAINGNKTYIMPDSIIQLMQKKK